MSSASFGTVNATGLNVSGILQASQVVTTKPIQVSNITATGAVDASRLNVSGATVLAGANATSLNVSGASVLAGANATSIIVSKNMVVGGSSIQKNDFMYVDAACPIPSMFLQDPNFTPTQAVAYFDKDTKIIYQGNALFHDPVKRSEVLYLNRYPFTTTSANPGSIQFTDFSLVDICNSNGTTISSVSAGYDMRSLAVSGQYVRWRANLAPITTTYLTSINNKCQYAYWRMNMSGIYLDLINVQGGFETIGGLFWYPFINSDIRNLIGETTIQIKGTTGVTSTANTSALSKVGLYPDLGSPVNAFKFAANYIIFEHHGMNDGFGRPMFNGHTWTSWLSNANELYEAMLKGDIWNTKYTNQEVSQAGPKFDSVDTANNYNQWNFGAKYSDANWNNYYSNAFITFVNTTRVGSVPDSNLYAPGPMSYGGLDNYSKIQLPTDNSCWGSSNLANASTFVQNLGASILPLRPVMQVREGMSYFDWCECVSHLFQQIANDPHCILKLFMSSAVNGTPYSAATVPLHQTGIIGSQFIANNGKLLVPYTFPSFYATKGSLTGQSIGKQLYVSRNVVNANRSKIEGSVSSTTNQSNIYSLTGKFAYKPGPAVSFVTNTKAIGFHYTDPVLYTDYAFGIISNALTSNNYGAISLSATRKDVLTGLATGGSINVNHNNLLSNVAYSNAYKNSIEYMLVTSALGLSGSLNANNVTVPYSSNLSLVQTYYTANNSILFTGIQADVLPAIPDNAPDDFGSQYFGYYARKVSTGNAWNSTTWFNGMTTSLETYRATLADTSFIPIDFRGMTSQFVFGQIDATQMSSKTNSNVVLTSNVGWATLASGIGSPTGALYTANQAYTSYSNNPFIKADPIHAMTTYGFNLDTQELRGLFALQTTFHAIYNNSGFYLPAQYGGLGPANLTGLCTTAIFDYMHNTLNCSSVIYDLRGFIGGASTVCLSAGHNYAQLDTANTWIDIGYVGQDMNKLSVNNQKWTPSETLYTGRKLGFNKETYRANPVRWFLLNDKYPTITVYAPNDNVKIIKLADGVTASGGEREVTSEGFLTCGRVGNAKIVCLARNTGGATAAYGVGIQDPTLSNSIFPAQIYTSGTIGLNTRNINGITYANQGVTGLEAVVLGDTGVPGVNLTYPGNYVNPALDTGLRTGWQDAGIDGSNVTAVRDFFVRGVDYIKPTSGPTLGNLKTQNWRDCDLERALLIDKNVSWDNFDSFAYYQANKSLFNYIPY